MCELANLKQGGDGGDPWSRPIFYWGVGGGTLNLEAIFNLAVINALGLG